MLHDTALIAMVALGLAFALLIVFRRLWELRFACSIGISFMLLACTIVCWRRLENRY